MQCFNFMHKNLALGLIKPHANLDQLPPGSDIISSTAAQPRNNKSQLNVLMLMETSKASKLTTNIKKISDVFSKKEQSQLIPESMYQVYQGVKVPVQNETRERECQINVYRKGHKNCQETPNIHMLPVKPQNNQVLYGQ